MEMDWMAEFAKWFVIVALVLGGPTLWRRYLLQSGSVRRTRRRLARSERRVRQLREITERYERLQVEQRSVEARQAALDTNDIERLAMLQQICIGLGAKADAEGRAPGSTALESDIEALLDAAASLGDEYSRSASLAHVIELYLRAGLFEQARSQARWVTDATVRTRLTEDPRLASLLSRPSPCSLLLRQVNARDAAPPPGGADGSGEPPRPESAA